MGNVNSTIVIVGLAAVAVAAIILFTGPGGEGLTSALGDLGTAGAGAVSTVSSVVGDVQTGVKEFGKNISTLAKPCKGTDEFKDVSDPNTCWRCPTGSQRTLAPINASNACHGLCSAQFGKRAFQDGLTGKCYTCPPGYNRTLDPITWGSACSSVCGAGTFQDGNNCWSCPHGYDRTLAPVTAGNACAKGIFGDTKPATRVRSLFSGATQVGTMDRQAERVN